jgi:hypothetical protein
MKNKTSKARLNQIMELSKAKLPPLTSGKIIEAKAVLERRFGTHTMQQKDTRRP